MPATADARFWDSIARKYAARPVGDEAGYARTLERTRHHLKPSDAVFEFGCGTGTTALKLAPAVARYVASDIAPAMIAIAEEKAKAEAVPNVEFAVTAPESAPFAAASFDAVLGFNVLHLIPARAGVLAAVHRLLKPGGLFVSKTPCLKEMNPLIRLVVPVAQAFGFAPAVAYFTADDLAREMEAAGFDIVERDRHGSAKKPEPRIFLVARKR